MATFGAVIVRKAGALTNVNYTINFTEASKTKPAQFTSAEPAPISQQSSTLGRRSVISVHGSGGKAMTMSGTCRLDCSGSPCSQQISNNTARPFIHSQQQQQIDTFTWTGKWKGRNQSKSECESLSKFTRQKNFTFGDRSVAAAPPPSSLVRHVPETLINQS